MTIAQIKDLGYCHLKIFKFYVPEIQDF
jgi:hypothetical protein